MDLKKLIGILSLCFCTLSLQAQIVNDTTRIPADLPLDSLSKVDPIRNPEKIDKVISYAKKFMGTPYRYAGMTPSGFDCSGFINYVMGDFGFSLARTSYNMAEYGKTVKLSEVRKGDLIFFKGGSLKSKQIGHVGLITEVVDGQISFIHSANGGVQITKFNNSRYYVPRFIKATRLDYGEPK
jgi:cell wall-associated NlpC family hydrolase